MTLILQGLRVLRWTELGEILQLVEMVYSEAGAQAPTLNLTFLCDNRSQQIIFFVLYSLEQNCSLVVFFSPILNFLVW